MTKHFSSFFIFILCTFVFHYVHSQDTNSPEIVLRNWIKIDKDTWPTSDKDDSQKKPFHFIYAEDMQNDGRSFNFNQSFFKRITGDLVKNPDLKFKYWTTTKNAALRYKSSPERKSETVYISKDNSQWNDLTPAMRNIDKVSWSQLNFYVIDEAQEYNTFTTAFKDVRVEYIDRQPIESLPLNPIHGHKGDVSAPTLSSNIESENPLKNLLFPSEADKSRLLLVYQNWAEVVLPRPVTVQLNETEPYEGLELLTFQLQVLPNGKVQKVTLKLEEWLDSCQNDLDLENAYIECTITSEAGKPNRKTLKSFRVFLSNPKNTDFAIWNAESVSKPSPTPVTLITTSAPVERTRFKVKKVTDKQPSFVNIVDSLREEKDWCYHVELKNGGEAKINVYLTLDGAPSGVQIESLDSKFGHDKKICINDFLPFSNLLRYQLTFETFSEATSFSFDVSKQAADAENFKILGPSLTVANLTLNQWFYFDPKADYSITRKGNENSKLAFSFCDQTLNCFPFDEEVNEKNVIYKIPEFGTDRILARSPFLRLKIDNFNLAQLKSSYTFAYFSPSTEAIIKAKPNRLSKPGPIFFLNSQTKCPPNFKSLESTQTCKLTSYYANQVVECDPSSVGCSNIFAVSLMSSKRYYDPKETSTSYFPYQNLGKPTESSLEIQLPESRFSSKNNDICLSFSYLSGSAPLFISTHQDEFNVSVEFPGVSATSRPGQVCASWFTRSPSQVDKFVMKFRKDVPLMDADDHLVTLSTNYLNEKPFSKDVSWNKGVYKGEDLKAVFEDSGRSPEFTVNENSVEYRLQNLKTLKNSQSTQISYLRSKWIRMSGKLRNQLLLSWTVEGSQLTSSSSSDLFETSLILSKSDGTSLNTLEGFNSLQPQRYNPLTLLHLTDYVQLTLKVKVNLKSSNVDQNDLLSFKLTNFILNDPCLSSDGGGPFSQSTDCQNGGYCVVGSYQDFTPKCACLKAFSGPNCEGVDYCTSLGGTGYCQSQPGRLKCRSISEREEFECLCPGGADEKWDPAARRCTPATVPSCPANQIPELNSGSSKYICVCVKGAIKVGADCVIYDPCNVNHRKATKQQPEIPCSDKDSRCFQVSGGFECRCQNGTYNELEIRSSTAVCFPNFIRNCAQDHRKSANGTWECSCNKGYHADGKGGCLADSSLDTSNCTSSENSQANSKLPKPFLSNNGKTCQCPLGFVFTAETKVCDIDQKLAKNFGCEKLEFKEDGRLGCVCFVGQKFDSSSRQCLAKCDDQAIEDCAADRKGVCRFDLNLKSPVCDCDSVKELKIVEKSSDVKNWKCASKCDALLRVKRFEEKRCTSDFTFCDPSGLNSFGNLLNGSIFSLESSTIISSVSDYCKCETGFRFSADNGQCVVNRAKPVRYIRGMEFDLQQQTMTEQFVEKVQAAFADLIKGTFSVKSLVDGETHCKGPNSAIFCDTAFEYEASEKVIKKRLADSCKPMAGNGKKCSYTTRSSGRFRRDTSGGESLNAILVRDVDAKIPVSTMDYCDKQDRCFAHTNSVCKPKKTGSTENSFLSFDCLCDLQYFEKVDSKSSQTFDQKFESCQPKDFCTATPETKQADCFDTKASCHSVVEYDFDLKIHVPRKFCVCPDNKVLGNSSHFCESGCTADYCSGHGLCAQDVYDRSVIVCRCIEGWTGPRCQLEKGVGGKGTTGLLVGTIVLALVAILSIVAIVVVYMKRKDELPLDWQIARNIQKWGRRGSQIRQSSNQSTSHQQVQQQGSSS